MRAPQLKIIEICFLLFLCAPSMYKILFGPNIYSVHLFEIIKLAFFLGLVAFSRKSLEKNIKINWVTLLGIFLSYFSVSLLNLNPIKENQNQIIIIWSFSCLLFYIFILIFSYINLGRNFSIFPDRKGLVTHGFYQHLRHPIYSSYIHIIAVLVIFNPNRINLAALMLLLVGLYLRAINEERILINDRKYVSYVKKLRCRLFAPAMTLPLMILILLSFTACSKGKTHKPQPIKIVFDYPLLSLNPTVYDDWTSVFIANHIFARLLPEKDSHKIIPYVAKKFEIECEGNRHVTRNCSSLIVKIDFQELKNCADNTYHKENITAEFFEILESKNWIFPEYERISCENDICLKGKYVKDLHRRFENVYFRFGWKNAVEGNMIGTGLYCLKTEQNQTNVKSGILEPKNKYLGMLDTIKFAITNDPHAYFDIALYGSEKYVTNERRNLHANTPLAYYIVTNQDLNPGEMPWNFESSVEMIRNHLKEEKLIVKEFNYNKLIPLGSKPANKKTIVSSKEERIFSLPKYVPSCHRLAENLTKLWENMGSKKYVSRCVDTSALIDKIIQRKFKEWHGFLSPLSPGAPAKEAIKFQYFSEYSRDSWVKHVNPEKYYTLIGQGLSLVTVNKKLYCGIALNSMGLSDLLITDFIKCEK